MPIDTIIDVLLDAVIDTVKLVPFLLLTYVAMEALEHAAAGKTERLVAQAGKSGPAIGALLGALPQCGFSAMAATLYAGRVITVGTLAAVILSTSDEMIPVFLAHQEAPSRLIAIIVLKVAVGLVAGFALDSVLRLRHHALFSKDVDTREALAELVHDHDEPVRGIRDHAHDHFNISGSDAGADANARDHADIHAHDHHGDHDHAADHDHHNHDHAAHDHNGHEHGAHGGLAHILRSAVSHTVEVASFIVLVSLIFGLFIEYIGEANLGMLLSVHPVRATLLAALVGLIPNCGASVALTELFLEGTLPAGAAVAGLLASGGVGLLVLFHTNDSLRRNLTITAFVYGVSVAVGLGMGVLGILL